MAADLTPLARLLALTETTDAPLAKVKEAQALAAEVDAELDMARRQFAAHATATADLARYAAHLRRVIEDTPFELRSDADEAMLAELAIKFPEAPGG